MPASFFRPRRPRPCVKRVRITLDPPEVALPPIYRRMTRGADLDAVRIENWNVSEPPTTFLLQLRGDYERFADELAADDAVAEFEIFPIDDASCYCYLTGEVDPASRALFENFTRGSLITVPPVDCHGDGSSTFTIVGTDADIQAAVDEVPEHEPRPRRGDDEAVERHGWPSRWCIPAWSRPSPSSRPVSPRAPRLFPPADNGSLRVRHRHLVSGVWSRRLGAKGAHRDLPLCRVWPRVRARRPRPAGAV